MQTLSGRDFSLENSNGQALVKPNLTQLFCWKNHVHIRFQLELQHQNENHELIKTPPKSTGKAAKKAVKAPKEGSEEVEDLENDEFKEVTSNENHKLIKMPPKSTDKLPVEKLRKNTLICPVLNQKGQIFSSLDYWRASINLSY